MKKLIVAILFLLTLSIEIYAVRRGNVDLFRISPGISIAYTFRAGFSYGAEVNLGFFTNSISDFDIYSGISLSYYWIHFRNTKHKIQSINIFAGNDMFNVQCGYGYIRNNWGTTKVNREKKGGLNYDISVSTNNQYTPWIGYKHFKSFKTWAWFKGPYVMPYLKYCLNYSTVKLKL